MWNFEGKSTQRKAINLGGKTASLSKQEILNHNREERKKREETRIRNKSASIIQTSSRKFLYKLQIAEERRVEFDQLISKLQSNTEEIVDHYDTFYQLVCLISSFYDKKRDIERVVFLLDTGSKQVQLSGSDIQIPFVLSPLYSTLVPSCWPYMINSLAKLGIKAFKDTSSSTLNFILAITEKSYFNNLSIKVENTSIYRLIQISLANNGIYKAFQKAITSGYTRNSIFIIIGRILKPETLRVAFDIETIQIYKPFIVEFLPLLSLVDILSNQLFNQLSKQLNFMLLIMTLEELIAQNILTKLINVNTFTLLCNVLDCTPNLKLMKSKDLLIYINVLSYLVSVSYKRKDFESEDSDDSDNELEVNKQQAEELSYKEANTETITASTKQMQSIEKLASIDLLRGMFKNITTQNDPNLKLLALYLFNIITQWPNTKFRISALINRTFPTDKINRSFVPILWELVCQSEFIRRIQNVDVNLLKDPIYKDDWSIFYLFLFSNDQHLSVLGDDKIDDNNGITSLTSTEFENLINILSSCLVKLILNRDTYKLDKNISNTTITLEEFKSLAISLLRKIHAKNSRQQFLSDNVWLNNWHLIQNSNFANQAATEFFDLQIALENQQDDENFNLSTVPSPLCDILQNIPFVVPFNQRVEIFSQLLFLERQRIEVNAPLIFARGAEQPVTIRRSSIFEDGFELLNPRGSKLKGRISISLVNQLGMAEAGIDGGGVFKEFLEELMNQAFSIEMQLFSTTNDHLLYPNPSIFNRNSNRLKYYEFLGRMVGKALYEGILIEASFAKFFLSNWLNKKSYIDDLPSLDNELYSGLMILKKYTGDVEKDFGLNFTLIDKDSTGNRAIELIPNGEKIAVTSMNKIEYIYYVANYRLNKQIQKQSTAFLNGINEILPLHWLKMFNEKELQMVISGTEQAIQISDFQENTVYSGVYDQNHPLIIAFWEIVKEMNHDTVARLLKFITSCQRPPLQGFKALNPPLCIRDSGRSDEWLPTASTCVNLLKLPIYSSKAILKKKLLYAINSESGFELS